MVKSVRTVGVFLKGEGNLLRQDNESVITHLVFWRKCSVVFFPCFPRVLLISPLSVCLSLSLSRLVKIKLCPLHDCYKLCIQRHRC